MIWNNIISSINKSLMEILILYVVVVLEVPLPTTFVLKIIQWNYYLFENESYKRFRNCYFFFWNGSDDNITRIRGAVLKFVNQIVLSTFFFLKKRQHFFFTLSLSLSHCLIQYIHIYVCVFLHLRFNSI